jgi:endonuclease/exonuclease/phosphatase (EEP) superfamily protein YafD
VTGGGEVRPARADSWLGDVGRIATLLGVVPLLATVTGFAGSWHWLLDLTSHFRLHAAAALLLVLPVSLLRRTWWWAAAFFAAAVVDLACAAPLWFGSVPAATAGGPSLQIVSFNVRTGNGRKDEVVEYLRRSGADVLVLFETDELWLQALDRLAGDYPHRTAEPRSDNFGIAVLARREPLHSELLRLGDEAAHSVELLLPWGTESLVVLATHPMPPVGAARTASRDAQLEAVAARVRTRGPQPVVVLGDLNATPWSHAFGRLCDLGELRDSARGFGWQPTWPARLAWLGIPIDHCLLRGDLAVAARSVGPYLGSDHRPLQVTVAAAR